MKLKEKLAEWTDYDIALFYVAVCLNIMDEEIWPPEKAWPTEIKWIFWTNNPMGNALTEIASQLVEVGVLEENEEQQLRWNPNFVGEWETGNA